MNKVLPIIIPSEGYFQALYYYIGSLVYHSIYYFFSDSNLNYKIHAPYILRRNELEKYFPRMDEKYNYGVVYEDG